MNNEDKTMEGLRKYGGKWHSVVPEPEIVVDKKKIHEEMKKHSQRNLKRV